MNRFFSTLTLIVVLAGASTSALAQVEAKTDALLHDESHTGFYLRFGTGISFVETENQYKVRGTGPSVDAYFGGTAARGLVLGGFLLTNTTEGFHDLEGNESTTGSMGLTAVGGFIDFFPNPDGGFHLLGQLGYASFNIGDASDNVSATGPMVGLAGGYDWAVSRHWSLGLMLRVNYAGVTTAESPTLNVLSPVLTLTALYY